MLASQLYAISQGGRCEGKESCHWCRGPCTQLWRHDDLPFMHHVKSAQLPRNPAGHFVCSGCWLWRRKSLTVNFLGGGHKDRQETKSHSWLLTTSQSIAINDKSGIEAMARILSPVLPFSLSIVTSDRVPNLLHLMLVNDQKEATAQTPFQFTIDHALYTYTVYELEEGIKNGGDGKSPGVRELLRLYGKKDGPLTFPPPSVDRPEVGRPKEESERSKGQRVQKMKRFLR